jgi:hypothetical protein
MKKAFVRRFALLLPVSLALVPALERNLAQAQSTRVAALTDE